jgi:hypothetical protein
VLCCAAVGSGMTNKEITIATAARSVSKPTMIREMLNRGPTSASPGKSLP